MTRKVRKMMSCKIVPVMMAASVALAAGFPCFASVLPVEKNDFWDTTGYVGTVTNSRASVPASDESFVSVWGSERASRPASDDVFDSWWFNFKASDPVSVFDTEPRGALLFVR